MADDAVAGAAQAERVGVNGPRARLELTGEAIMNAIEAILPGIAQVQVGEELPDIKRQLADYGLFYFAIPAHEARNECLGNPVRQEEVDLLLLENSIPELLRVHPIGWKWIIVEVPRELTSRT